MEQPQAYQIEGCRICLTAFGRVSPDSFATVIFWGTVTPNFFERASNGQPDKSVRCRLCPHRCTLRGVAVGLCGVRSGEGGGGLPFYGRISSIAIDPIEKKPLFHYRPGQAILSVGFVGCNLRCPFCQNWQISQTTEAAGNFVSPEELVEKADALGLEQIAYTYSEPLVHAEYLINCMMLARSCGIANVLVTNGCINGDAAAEIIPFADAANIDLKCFSPYSYKNILGGSLSAVKDFIKTAAAGIHTEVTTLIVPDFNDSAEEIDSCIDFIASVSNEIPWHINAYHPAYKLKTAPTKTETILDIKKRAGQKLLYCYTGNIGNDENDTVCMNCGCVLIRRNGYVVKTPGLAKKIERHGKYRCGQCGAVLPVKY
ncbi:MAG: AmmeMemoRadiSam system radical SAM enzyme [Spirochaetaceae bacterium]|nr:AmmeMemoRadiSam system radical SAM enzyme [Spirochaetaceae bacterium]